MEYLSLQGENVVITVFYVYHFCTYTVFTFKDRFSDILINVLDI